MKSKTIMDIMQTAKELTIAEYVMLREISQLGDYDVEDLNDKKSLKSLIKKDLLAFSSTKDNHVYPTNQSRQALLDARYLLGVLNL